MPKSKILLAGVACLSVLTAMSAHAQALADDTGVTVNLNGSQIMHRTPIVYPVDALKKGVEGTVVVQVRLDANGEVIDAAILSGPDELHRGVQQSVLNWHFDKSAASSTRVVNVDFVKRADTAIPMAVKSSDPVPTAVVPVPQLNMLRPIRQPVGTGTIDSIEVTGLSDSAKAELLAQFPIHAGDPFSSDTLRKATDAARQFDSHLTVGIGTGPSGVRVLSIRPQQASVFTSTATPSAGPVGAVNIGANVVAANLVSATKPLYPPLAKMARQQGTVKFEAIIGKDGTMEELSVISGPPLLIQAATDAVKQWIYKPTLLNGNPVEVRTTIDVNFTLADNPSAAPAQ